MTDPKGTRPYDASDLVEDALLEQELERLEGLSVEQLREEMRKKGVDPARAREATARALGVPPADVGVRAGAGGGGPAGKVVDFASAKERRRGNRTVLYAALAVAAAVGALAVGSSWRQIGGAIDAYFNPAPTENPVPKPTAQPETHEPTPQEKAAELRKEALVNVQKWYFGLALDQLEDAKELDPDGDNAQPIQDARAACKAGIEERRVAPPSAKFGIEPWEKPLKKPAPIQR